jgi:hypothetical protein
VGFRFGDLSALSDSISTSNKPSPQPKPYVSSVFARDQRESFFFNALQLLDVAHVVSVKNKRTT